MTVNKVLNYGDTKGSANFKNIINRPYEMRYEGDKYTAPGFVRYIWGKSLDDYKSPDYIRFNIDVNEEHRIVKYEPESRCGFYVVCRNSDDFDGLYNLIKSKLNK